MRKINSGLFENITLFQNPRPSAATGFTFPQVFLETAAIFRFQAATDAVL
jgi:hypothetical protein